MPEKIGSTAYRVRFLCLCTTVALAMIMYSSLASAQVDLDETITIDLALYYETLITGIKTGDVINVNIQVINGSPIDVLLINSGDHEKYLEALEFGSSFKYNVDGSALSIKSKTYSYTFPESGDYYLVIDNTAEPQDGTIPIGAVDVHSKITIISTSATATTPAPTITATSTPPASVTPTQTATQTPATPGFEAILAVLVIVALALWRR